MKQLKKTLTLIALLLAATGLATAQPIESVEVDGNEINPGVFGPDSLLYPAQVGWDNLVNDEGENAVRRAIEANQMLEQGNSPEAERALNQLNQTASSANSDQNEYLFEARNTVAEAPHDDNAREGINTAINALEEAQDRTPENTGSSRFEGFTRNTSERAASVLGTQDRPDTDMPDRP